MRSFASAYFFTRMATYLGMWMFQLLIRNFPSNFYFAGILFSAIALLCVLSKPYKKSYMNVMDALLLFLFSVFCHTLALHSEQYGVLLIKHILLYIPLSLLIIYIIVRILLHGPPRVAFKATIQHVYKLIGTFIRCCSSRLGKCGSQNSERELNEVQGSSDCITTPQEPLNQPTRSVISYGTCD